MKKILFSIAVALLVLVAPAHAQSGLVALPAATQHAVTLSWVNACPATQNCTFSVYKATGTCPATGAVAWTLIATTAPDATSYVDLAVTPGDEYSYVLYANGSYTPPGGNPIAETAGPSNCTTATVPNGPSLPTGVSATAQ
jgi:hypothetical protein